MKQLLPLFLFLLPCLALAQYPTNGNQKITLGEQTTADGLVYRGLAADTTRKPSVDTMAYIILDTATNIQWHYKKATSNAWLRIGGSISSGLTGVLPVANGGTGSATQNFVDLTTTQTVAGAKTFSSAATFNTNLVINKSVTSASPVPLVIFSADELYNHLRMTSKTGSNTTRRAGLSVQDYEGSNSIGIFSVYSDATTNDVIFGGGVSNLKLPTIISFYTGGYNLNGNNSTKKITSIDSLGRVKIGDINNYAAASQQLHVIGNARITAMNGIGDIGADANGVLQAATSDMNLKNTIENSPFGLNEILLLNPVTFLYNDTDRKIDSDAKEVGFIAQDVFDIIPNAVSSTGTGDLQLDYRAITATLTKAIQEQQALIKALEQRIINLENK
jgi:hypothetical protein